MRIEFQRTGGLAASAMKRSVIIDTSDLSESERAQVASLVSTAASAPAPASGGEPRPDAFGYKITIHDDSGGSQVLRASDSTMHDSVRPLVAWLQSRASFKR